MLKDRVLETVKRSATKSAALFRDPVTLAERMGMYDAVPLALARSRGAMRLMRAAVSRELAPVAPTALLPIVSLGSATLYRYVPRDEKAFAAAARPSMLPVLLSPSLINRPYVLDLTDGNSLVQGLHAEGRTVYTIDWGDPGDA